MQDFLNKIRQKSEKDKKVIALSVSTVVVVLIFSVWATSLISRLNQGPEVVVESGVVEEPQKASVFDSIKRKTGLLFGEGSPLKDIDLKGFSKPIEYNSQDVEELNEKDRNLDLILEEFNETKNSSSSLENVEDLGGQNSEISF